MFSHVELNVSDLETSERFYLSALSPLGFSKADSAEGEYVRLTNGRDAVIVLCPVEDRFRHLVYHRKGVGLSHFALAVGSRSDVDKVERHLEQLGVPLLGDSRVELGYRRGYYCLVIEDPDRIMVEIVYHDPHYFSLLPP